MRLLLPLLAATVACTSPTPSDAPDASTINTTADASVQPDAGAQGCGGGPCVTTTSLAVSFGNRSATLNRAQMGVEHSDGGVLFYVEAHAGGDPDCPNESTPTPDQTLVLANIPAAAPGTTWTYEDGLRGSLLDFEGTVLDSIVPARATAISVTLREVSTGTPPFVVFDLSASFEGGTINGTVSATHCTSLDGP